MNKHLIKYGIYSAAFLTVVNLVIYLIMGKPEPSEYQISEVIGYSAIVLALVFVFLGIKYRRDHELNGQISFGQGFLSGLIITLFPSLAFGIYNWIYMKYMDPEFVDQYFAHSMAQAEAKMDAAEFEAYAANMEANMDMYTNPIFNGVLMFVTVLLIGIIISVISALILKSKGTTEA